MEIRTVSMNELRAAEYNPRIELRPGMPGYERLKRSIDEFGLVQPIVWNEQTGHVVGGHQRLAVLKFEGHESVDVVVVALDEPREKALNVALNNVQVGGDWDMEKLRDVMQDLQALPEIDETLTGFDAKDVRELLLLPDENWRPVEDDDEGEIVRVTLEVAAERWDEVRPDVDALVREWGLRSHVRE